MKVCFVTSYFHPVIGGAENHIYYISKELIKMGHEIEVFVSDSARNGTVKEKESIIDGIKVRRFKTLFKVSQSGVFFPGLYKAVKNSDADVFHVHGYRHPFNFIFWFTKKPCFITPHWPNYPKGSRKKIIEFLIDLHDKSIGKYVFSKYTKTFAVSALEILWLIDNFSLKKEDIILTPNCIPDNYFKKYNGNKFRKKYKIKKNELLVLSVARINKTKGLDQLIRVAVNFPKVKFVFAGIDDGYLEELKRICKKLKLRNVLFTGKISDEEKMCAYAAANIFCHPSHYEAFGIVVLEAFSQHTAVLTSNQGGLPWVTGNAGLIFEDNNLEDLKNKLGLLIKNEKLRKELSLKGLKRAKEFSWKRTAKIIEKEYKKFGK